MKGWQYLLLQNERWPGHSAKVKGWEHGGKAVPNPRLTTIVLDKDNVEKHMTRRLRNSTPSISKTEGREWGVGAVVVESAFLGHPAFHSRGPKTFILKGFGAIWGKNLGRPNRRSNDGSNAPFSAL